MKRIAIFATLAAALAAQSGHSGAQSVIAVRHWEVSEATRVAIEVTGDFEFRTDRLHNPERVYYDILNARPYIAHKRAFAQTLDDKRVSRIRVAETTPGTTRVVLDLTGPSETGTSLLTNPSRLIIEVRSAPAESPLRIPAEPSLAPAPAVSAAAPVTPPVSAKIAIPEPGKMEAPKPEPAKLRQPAAPVLSPRAASGSASLVRALGLKLSRVVIDAGHGGHDEGTRGPKGLLEKDLVLDVALRVGKLISEKMPVEVIYTRTNDTFVPLEGRTALANEKKADLFLSIHANSSPYARIAGVETYYLNFPDSREAAALAARENASSEKSVFELQDVIQKITSHDKAEESRDFAGRVQTSLQALSARNFPGIKNRGVKKAPFVVLIGAHMPSILAEVGFLTNSREETLLKRSDYRQKLAEALFRGVEKYAQSLSHFDVVAQAKEE